MSSNTAIQMAISRQAATMKKRHNSITRAKLEKIQAAINGLIRMKPNAFHMIGVIVIFIFSTTLLSFWCRSVYKEPLYHIAVKSSSILHRFSVHRLHTFVIISYIILLFKVPRRRNSLFCTCIAARAYDCARPGAH